MAKPLVSGNFHENVRTAISVMAAMSDQSEDGALLRAFISQGIESSDARTILILLPIAFCRQMLPQLAWEDRYQEMRSWPWGTRKRRFSQTPAYQVVWEEVSACLAGTPGGELVLKIAGRSAEFHAINDLLNAGGKMEDIAFTPMMISW